MDFDQILKEIGEFGLFQKKIYFLICLPVLCSASIGLSYVFTASVPNYRCYIPECEDYNNTSYESNFNLHHAVPGKQDHDDLFKPDNNCLRFRPKNYEDKIIKNYECPNNLFIINETVKCNKWIFDDEVTIVNEWEITCDENAWNLAMVGTTHFAGLVIGTMVSGLLADRFGRKIIFILSIVFMSITGIFQGLAWNYYSFLTFVFLNAIGTAAVYPLAFIIGVEMVGPSKREMSSIVLNYFYAVGEALVGLVAYLCKNWRLIQFVISTPPILCAVYYWFVPESVRWLIAKNQRQKATKIIRKAAKVNGKKIPESLVEDFEKTSKLLGADSDAASDTAEKNGEYSNTFKKILKSRILLPRCAILLYVWAVNAFVFYGLSLNATSLSGSKYLNYALVCLVEIPGYSLAWIVLKKLGRRFSLSGSMLLCGLTCAAGAYVQEETRWAGITLFLIGKLGITSSFAVCYTYTAEMLPTIIRSGGVGCMSTFARFGAMVAPFVTLLGNYYKPLPLMLFAAVSSSGAFLGLMLPETFKQKLPNTVKEAENIGCTKS